MKKIVYKIDVMQELKNHGYSSTRLRREKLLAESTMTQFRRKELVSWKNMNTICNLLDCDISDIIHCVNVEN